MIGKFIVVNEGIYEVHSEPVQYKNTTRVITTKPGTDECYRIDIVTIDYVCKNLSDARLCLSNSRS